jgi:hypothetical protein
VIWRLLEILLRPVAAWHEWRGDLAIRVTGDGWGGRFEEWWLPKDRAEFYLGPVDEWHWGAPSYLAARLRQRGWIVEERFDHPGFIGGLVAGMRLGTIRRQARS